jgi:4-cresol dehydrogenase (hydroxylating)
MGFWLLPEPEAVRGLRVIAARHDDVRTLVATIANLAYAGIVDSQFALRSPVLHGERDAEHAALVQAGDGGAAADWDRYAAERELPFWNLDLSFYGPAGLVDLKWAYALERFRAIPDVRFANAPTYRFPMSREQREQVPDKQLLGIPSLEGFTGRRVAEPEVADGHVDFSIVVPMTGDAVLTALKAMLRVLAETDVDVGMGALTSFHPRTLTFISSFPTRRDDAQANRRMRAAYLRALAVATELGFGQYRAHAAFMDDALAAYSFNDHALRRFHERLKAALDPNGILAAGRYGIWPPDSR